LLSRSLPHRHQVLSQRRRQSPALLDLLHDEAEPLGVDPAFELPVARRAQRPRSQFAECVAVGIEVWLEVIVLEIAITR
jgi:hypothetical protein